jgi:AcrR family transcriptional regulator
MWSSIYTDRSGISQGMAKTRSETGSARERLLAAANELFYEEGVHTVGIDRVIERAGVAKASLYSTFGSKDELVRAYLAARFETRRRRITQAIDGIQDPRDQLLAIYDLMGEIVAEPDFRGCAFARASAEARPDHPGRAVCADSRAWTRSLFIDLCRGAGSRRPEDFAQELILLYDGAVLAAQMDRNASSARAARRVAERLLDAELGPRSAVAGGQVGDLGRA